MKKFISSFLIMLMSLTMSVPVIANTEGVMEEVIAEDKPIEEDIAEDSIVEIQDTIDYDANEICITEDDADDTEIAVDDIVEEEIDDAELEDGACDLNTDLYEGNEYGDASTTAKYKITYKLNGGKNNSKNPASYTEKTKTIVLKNASRKGYSFKGWYKDSKYKKKITQINKGSKGNITLYAKWEQSVFYVSTKGSNSNPGTEAKPYKTIQKGIDSAKAGQTIIVEPGTYSGAIRFKRSGKSSKYITLKAASSKKSLITLPKGKGGCIIDLNGQDYIKISGFEIGKASGNTVYNCKSNYADNAGIYVDGARDTKITNNTVYNNLYGIEIGSEEGYGRDNTAPVTAITVSGNKIYDNPSGGIRIGGYDVGISGTVKKTIISGNTLENNGSGEGGYNGEINIEKTNGVQIKNNIIKKSKSSQNYYPFINIGSDVPKQYIKNLKMSGNTYYTLLDVNEIPFDMFGKTYYGLDTKNGFKNNIKSILGVDNTDTVRKIKK